MIRPIVYLLILAASYARAQDLLTDVFARPAVALKDFEDLALANNPTLKQAAAILQRSQGLARQAGLYPNPLIGYQGEQIRGGSFQGGEQGGFVQQTIVLGGKLGLRRQAADEQRKADEIGVTEQRYRVLSDVGQSFYSALGAQETVKLRQRLVALAADAVETAHQLANVGQADTPDILEAEVEAEQAGVYYLKAQRAFIQAFRNLAVMSGKPDMAMAPLAGDLDKPHTLSDDMIARIIRDSPSIRRARQETTRAETDLKSARREVVPDLQIRVGVQQNFEAINAAGRSAGMQGFASAGISLPLFNRNQGNVEAARAGAEFARSEVLRSELSLRHTAEPLIQTVLAEQEEARRYKTEMLPRAARAYQLYLTKYQQMGAAYPQVIISQRTLFQLQAAYIQVLADLWRNTIALENFTLSGGLNALASGVSSSVMRPVAGGSIE